MQPALMGRPRRTTIIYFIVFILCLITSINWGPGGPLISNQLDEDVFRVLLWEIRLPRVILSALCGGSLASAGVISQGLFRNPLAGPSIMGSVSSANLFVVSLMYLGFTQEQWYTQPIAAIIGSLLSSLVVLYLVQRSSHQLLLVGFALNTMYAAMTSFILSISLPRQDLSQAIIYWLMGGFNAKGWSHINIALPWCMVGMILAIVASRQLNVLNLGEEIATTIGISVKSLRITSLAAMTFLISGTVAAAGSIGFVGLIVPHITRLCSGMEHRSLVLLCFINGASLVMIADTASRCLWAPQEIQVGAILALIGSPLFIWLLIDSKRLSSWS